VRPYKTARILVVVKTYPNPSRTYGETVCCAGVDLARGEWVRLYPVTFRRLDDARFAKYQEIECLTAAPRNDSRPESRHVNNDSIRLIGPPMAAGRKGWARRMAMLPVPIRSLEAVQDAQSAHGTSIGMLRPRRIERLVIEKAKPWGPKELAAISQQRLDLSSPTSRELRDLDQIPWDFSYRFTCDDPRCTGHELRILDWEIGASYRKWSRTDPGRWEEMIREKYERELPARDLHLVVGNLAKRRHTFLIIGLVYPPRVQVDGVNVQGTLDLMGEQRTVAAGGIGLEAEKADALAVDHGKDALELFPDEG